MKRIILYLCAVLLLSSCGNQAYVADLENRVRELESLNQSYAEEIREWEVSSYSMVPEKDLQDARTLLDYYRQKTESLEDQLSALQTPPSKPQEPSVPQPSSPKPAENTSALTMGQKNALREAESYLSIMSFSHSGLIKQLEYEGYSAEDATYAADHCGADWYEQAVLEAESYLEIMAFSRIGLIDQLVYEGYTLDQAEHAANAVGY